MTEWRAQREASRSRVDVERETMTRRSSVTLTWWEVRVRARVRARVILTISSRRQARAASLPDCSSQEVTIVLLEKDSMLLLSLLQW